jgi:sugar phosphate isomerase/epimerase
MNLNRRDFGKLALAAAAVPAGSLLAAAKPNSVYGGVQMGVITYSFRAMPDAHTDAAKMLQYIVDSGASGIELMADVAEAYAGSPTRGAAGRGPMAQTLKDWRLSVTMDKYQEFHKMYNDAGVTIYAFKLEPMPTMSDDELNYIFSVAATLGATHVTRELHADPKTMTTDMAFTQRCGDLALKHGVVTAYHTHEDTNFTAWDAVLAQSKGNAVNMDCGHYFAGTGESPVPLIEKLHDRIASIHLKDRGKGGVTAPNLPWGQSDTPIIEILQLMKAKQYKFPASVELEYAVPPGSDSVVEVKKCIEYARKALA